MLTTLTALKQSSWETTRCEHCGTEYGWRVGGLVDDAVRAGSAVHCPRCGRYQAAMLATVRRETFGFFTVLGVLAGVVALIIGVLAVSPAALLFVGVSAALFCAGRWKMAGFDPNADAALRTGVRQHSHVVLREEYELVRTIARSKGALTLPLRWRGHAGFGSAA